MNKQNFVSDLFFTILLIAGWIGIIFVSFLFYLLSDVYRLFGNGVLVYISVCVYALAFIVPIVFRKRLSKYFSLPLSIILFSVLSVMAVCFIFVGAKSYISDFSREKWDSNEKLRVYMLDSLEDKHGIIGKTDREIVELLGEPAYITDDINTKYEYYVGDSMIDPYGYQIEFENNIAVKTALVEH